MEDSILGSGSSPLGLPAKGGETVFLGKLYQKLFLMKVGELDFPERMSADDALIRFKEWQLLGYKVSRFPITDHHSVVEEVFIIDKMVEGEAEVLMVYQTTGNGIYKNWKEARYKWKRRSSQQS